jgi:hypothetical protein
MISVEAHVLLLKDNRRPAKIIVNLSSLLDDEGLNGIRCPLCAWRPDASSRWSCLCIDTPEPPFRSCGTSWNTFATKGRCPGCQHQWQWTSCLRCQEWSLHVDWYEQRGRA